MLALAQGALPAPVVVVADPMLLEERVRRLGAGVTITIYDAQRPPRAHLPGQLHVLPAPLGAPAVPGQLNPDNASYVLRTLDVAVRGCLSGEFSALVTGPVHKGNINAAGVLFSGHTEYLAALSAAPCPVMVLTTPGLRVALATTHVPLAKVSGCITQPRLMGILRVLAGDLRRRFSLAHPRILVCGLNPHAGEEGYLGREDADVIVPVVERLRAEGMGVTGPVPADTAFTPSRLEHTDVVLAMYHDQGLPVLKHMGFGQAVNITFGLPFIRTSVDHGTALDLAGTGRADANSLAWALRTALEMIRHGAPVD